MNEWPAGADGRMAVGGLLAHAVAFGKAPLKVTVLPELIKEKEHLLGRL